MSPAGPGPGGVETSSGSGLAQAVPGSGSGLAQAMPGSAGSLEGAAEGTLSRALPWVGLALVSALYLSRIGGFVLQDPDEGRYVEIPREMLESGDWITPHLNYVKYFEKPPLLYWLVGLSFRFFGITEGAARLVPALAGIATVALTYRLGRSLFGRRAGLIGAAFLATSPLFFVLSQAVVIDMLLTACVSATLGAVFGAHRASAKAPWAVAAAAAAGLGVLAKGLVALVLPGAIALAFLCLRRDWPTLRALLRPPPLAVFAVVVVPWFAAVAWRNPEFLQFFFVREHFERFAGGTRIGHPEGPFYYLPVLLGGPMPWTILAVMLAASRRGRAAWRELPGESRLFLGLWAGAVVIFFSAASSKLAPYVLPAMPPLALLLGAWVERLLGREAGLATAIRVVAWGFLALGLLSLAVGAIAVPLAGPLASRFEGEPTDVTAIAAAALWAGLALAVSGAVIVRGARQRNIAEPAALVIVVVGLGAALLAAIGGRTVAKTSRDLADAIARETRDGAPHRVVAYRRVMQSLAFYTGGRVTQFDPDASYGELEAGAGWAPDRDGFFWTDIERLRREWRSGSKVFVATDLTRARELIPLLAPEPRILARDGRRVLLVNFPAGGEPGVAPATPDPPALDGG